MQQPYREGNNKPNNLRQLLGGRRNNMPGTQEQRAHHYHHQAPLMTVLTEHLSRSDMNRSKDSSEIGGVRITVQKQHATDRDNDILNQDNVLLTDSKDTTNFANHNINLNETFQRNGGNNYHRMSTSTRQNRRSIRNAIKQIQMIQKISGDDRPPIVKRHNQYNTSVDVHNLKHSIDFDKSTSQWQTNRRSVENSVDTANLNNPQQQHQQQQMYLTERSIKRNNVYTGNKSCLTRPMQASNGDGGYGELSARKRDSINAEGVLYDLNKLQKSLFNQKRRREVDPLMAKKHTKQFPDYLKKVAVRYRRSSENSISSRNAIKVASSKEFAQVTGKVFEFNQDFRNIAPSQFALSQNSKGSNESENPRSSQQHKISVRTRTAPSGQPVGGQRRNMKIKINLEKYQGIIDPSMILSKETLVERASSQEDKRRPQKQGNQSPVNNRSKPASPSTKQENNELKVSAPLVRRYQFVNNLIRVNQATKLRDSHNDRSRLHLHRPYDNCKPIKVPILFQKERLTEKVGKLLGHATQRDRMANQNRNTTNNGQGEQNNRSAAVHQRGSTGIQQSQLESMIDAHFIGFLDPLTSDRSPSRGQNNFSQAVTQQTGRTYYQGDQVQTQHRQTSSSQPSKKNSIVKLCNNSHGTTTDKIRDITITSKLNPKQKPLDMKDFAVKLAINVPKSSKKNSMVITDQYLQSDQLGQASMHGSGQENFSFLPVKQPRRGIFVQASAPEKTPKRQSSIVSGVESPPTFILSPVQGVNAFEQTIYLRISPQKSNSTEQEPQTQSQQQRHETRCFVPKGDPYLSATQTANLTSTMRTPQSIKEQPKSKFTQEQKHEKLNGETDSHGMIVDEDGIISDDFNHREQEVRSALVQTLSPTPCTNVGEMSLGLKDQLQEQQWDQHLQQPVTINLGHQVSTCSQTDELMVSPQSPQTVNIEETKATVVQKQVPHITHDNENAAANLTQGVNNSKNNKTTAERNTLLVQNPIPQINLNEIVNAFNKTGLRGSIGGGRGGFQNSSYRSNNRGDFQLLQMNTFQIPSGLLNQSAEMAANFGERRVIHVNKRPNRDPFYCQPDKQAFRKSATASQPQRKRASNK